MTAHQRAAPERALIEPAAAPIIGALLLDAAAAVPIVSKHLSATDFTGPAEAVFRTVERLIEKRGVAYVTLETVGADLRRQGHGDIDAVTLSDCVDACPPTIALHLPAIVADYAVDGRARRAASLMKDAAGKLSAVSPELVGEYLREVADELRDLAPAADCTAAAVDVETWLREPAPEHDPIFENVVDMGRLGMLIASPKKRKSFFTLQAGLCLAAGRDFLGWPVPRPRKVLVVQFEVHPADMHRRFRSMLDALQIHPDQLRDDAGQLRIKIINAKASAWDAGGVKALREIGAAATAWGAEVVIVDPLFRLQPNGDESIEFLRPLILALDRMSVETGAFVWAVHHDCKGESGDKSLWDRGSGSNVVGRAAYWSCALTPHDNGDPAFVHVEHGGNGYPPDAPFSIEWNNGCFVRRDDVLAAKRTSVTRSKAPAPDMDAMADAALEIVAGGPVPVHAFIAKFIRKTGLPEKKERLVRAELTEDGTIQTSIREPQIPGRKFIGTPADIERMENEWHNQRLKT